ncbi:hypothetical protein J3E73DRAFT_364105 [Bipolaris maydis]|nr:hypothetical protein J3E73DRAFT_364105 [Bipolaris maydis]
MLESLRAADWWIWEICQSSWFPAEQLMATLLRLASLNNKPLPSWAFGDKQIAMASSESTSSKLMCRLVGISVNARGFLPGNN